MPYRLDQINQAVRQDSAAFMEAGDAAFQQKVCQAADLIQAHRDKSPVVLLSGPSGSGKTTTAGMIDAELERRGIRTHTISMDDYFITPDPAPHPAPHRGDGFRVPAHAGHGAAGRPLHQAGPWGGDLSPPTSSLPGGCATTAGAPLCGWALTRWPSSRASTP